MDRIILKNSFLKGKVNIPASKSLAHRAIICASLSNGKSVIKNMSFSDDINATIEAMKNLGAEIEIGKDYIIIKGITKIDKNKKIIIDCNESGSTLRFLIPIALSLGIDVRFIGKGKLAERPIDIYYDIMKKNNINYVRSDTKLLDLSFNGKLKGGIFNIRGDISSQFITGLLLSLPLMKEDSVINITTSVESKEYIDLTLDIVEKFGIKIINDDYKKFIIKGNQKYKSYDYVVEGDYSQAAFFLVANAIGNEIVIDNLNENSNQGDKYIIKILKDIGVKCIFENSKLYCERGELNGIIIDGKNCPDIIPIVSLMASIAKGTTIINNIGRLRIKECDRLNAIRVELNKLGANIEEFEDKLIIHGVKELRGNVTVSSHNDHRIAMMLSIASTIIKEDIVLEGYKSVSKSYPNFYKDFRSLGGKIDEQFLGE